MHPHADRHIHPVRLIVVALAAVLLAASVLVSATPAHAASRGTGFGTWAPVSPYGWHGSMLVDGVHTYCILPGAPAPTGASVDHGVRTAVLDLSPRQLRGINLLVTKYGQTSDPVQAAAVAWSVKAIVDWDAALHHYGYRGSSLAGAINWTFSALAPAHNAAVQARAVAYYNEATRIGADGSAARGTLAFTTDPADHRHGTVTAKTVAGSTGSITLSGAKFVLTGSSTLARASAGVAYEIRTTSTTEGRPHTVRGTGTFSAGFAAAVRHYTTRGGQDTAGPGGGTRFEIAGADATPRAAAFVPAISTQVGARYSAGGPFVDDVTVTVEDGEWPRNKAGDYLPLTASATVYRTDAEPSPSARAPADAVEVGRLTLVTEPGTGPDRPYRVTSEWTAGDPGFYTAVWSIRRGEQPDPAALRLANDYAWTEEFGVASQVMMVADISSRAQDVATAGESVSDTVLVGGPVPTGGLDISSSLYLAADGVKPADACVPEYLVWASPPQRVTAEGTVLVTAPAVTAPGTYYWQERAADTAGAVVHLGECGIAEETTQVVAAPQKPAETPPPPQTPASPPAPPAPAPRDTPNTATPPPPSAPEPGPAPETIPPSTTPPLAETGVPEDATRAVAGVGITLGTLGATLLCVRHRRRFEPHSSIG